MAYASDHIIRALRAAREHSGLSQRDLSARIGLPQSHISKIESGTSDLRLSSLVELTRGLDHELVLVPRKLLPTVEAMIGNASPTRSDDVRLRSAVLNRARAAIARLGRAHPEEPIVERLSLTLSDLADNQLGGSDLDTIRSITDRLLTSPNGSDVLPALQRASQSLRALRNRIARIASDAPRRPAYSLDEEEDEDD